MVITANGLYRLDTKNRCAAVHILVGGTLGTTNINLVLLDENDFEVVITSAMTVNGYVRDKGMGETFYIRVSAISGNSNLTVRATAM